MTKVTIQDIGPLSQKAVEAKSTTSVVNNLYSNLIKQRTTQFSVFKNFVDPYTNEKLKCLNSASVMIGKVYNCKSDQTQRNTRLGRQD